jgi:hypothetical protein
MMLTEEDTSCIGLTALPWAGVLGHRRNGVHRTADGGRSWQSVGLAGRLTARPGPQMGLDGGRTWWAHFAFTRINIEPTILRKKIEDLRDPRASTSIAD